MKLASILFLAITGLAGCADPGAEPRTSTQGRAITEPSCECRDVPVTKWNRETTNYWDHDAASMTLILHPAKSATTEEPAFYAWLVADASRVTVVYRVLVSDFPRFNSLVTSSFTTSAAGDNSRSWGVAGGIGPGPGPVGPGPNGDDPPMFAPADVGRVLRTAGSIVDSTRATLDYHSPTTGE